jgi:hypothetical protein
MTEKILFIKSAEECYAAFIQRKTRKQTIKERQRERKMRVTFPLTIGKMGHRNQCWNCLEMKLYVGPPSKKKHWTTDDYRVCMGEMWCIPCCGDDGFKGGVNNEESMYELLTFVKNGIIQQDVGDFREERKCDCGCWKETIAKPAKPAKPDDDDDDINEQLIYKGRMFD